jgi:competence protein ComEC
VPLSGEQEDGADAGFGENDRSIVLAVDHAGRRLLFPGDLERDGEAALLATGLPSADVVKVPHHGSKTSSTPALVAALHPALAVISVGTDNRWHFPSPGVVDRWRSAGARVLRTDENGSIGVTVRADGTMETRTLR